MGPWTLSFYAGPCTDRRENSNTFFGCWTFLLLSLILWCFAFPRHVLLLAWHSKLLTICLTERATSHQKSCLLIKPLLTDLKVVVFFPPERDCVQVAARRVLCLLSCSHVRIQPTQFVPTVTRWILRATTADSLPGIKPINLANNICHKEDQMRPESLFGLYLGWRFCKQNLVHDSSDGGRATAETPLLSLLPLFPSQHQQTWKLIQKILSENLVDHAQEGKKRWEVWERIMHHMWVITLLPREGKNSYVTERRENNQTCSKSSCEMFSVFLSTWRFRNWEG